MPGSEAWRTPLSAYLGTARLIKEGQEEAIERDGQKGLRLYTESYQRGDLSDFETISDFAGDPDLVLFHKDERFAILSRSQDRMIAVMTAWFPYNDPEFRSRSLMAHVLKSQEERGQRMRTGSYTVAGLMNRVKAHRLHVQSAIDRGDEVPDEVMRDYRVENGCASLRDPFDPYAREARMRAASEERNMKAHQRKTAHLDVSFQKIERNEDGELCVESMVEYAYMGEDAPLALAILSAHGGVLEVNRVGSRDLHHVRIGDKIVDAFGICSQETFSTHLAELYDADETEISATHRFSSVEDYKASEISPKDERSWRERPEIIEMAARAVSRLEEMGIRPDTPDMSF